MGRGKIEIKRIENSTNRHVTYSKRRNGLMKKAKEIAVLCDAHVSLVIIASSGKIHEYCSHPNTLINIMEKYHKHSGKKLWDAKHENLSNELDRIKKENDSMQVELRHIKGEDITSLQYKELMTIEESLENGLAIIRDKQERILMLAEEDKSLSYKLQQLEMAMEDNVRQMNNGYHPRAVRDYNTQMSFAFCVQPIQPNLQERI
uniref:PI n=1 Tax=Cercidiphyllum japonicum TaxID=13413 RepID=A0A2H4L6K9_CERJA|nr:PI [Cercidiphyllum japonicum]